MQRRASIPVALWTARARTKRLSKRDVQAIAWGLERVGSAPEDGHVQLPRPIPGRFRARAAPGIVRRHPGVVSSEGLGRVTRNRLPCPIRARRSRRARAHRLGEFRLPDASGGHPTRPRPRAPPRSSPCPRFPLGAPPAPSNPHIVGDRHR